MKTRVRNLFFGPRRSGGLGLLRWAGFISLVAAALVPSACTTFSDTQDMRMGINETKMDVQSLQTNLKESVMRLEYRLDQIDSKLASQQEIDKIFNQQIQDDLARIRAGLQVRAGEPRRIARPTVETRPVAEAGGETPDSEPAPSEPAPSESAASESAAVETAPGETAAAEPAPSETGVSAVSPAETAPVETAPIAEATPAVEPAPSAESPAALEPATSAETTPTVEAAPATAPTDDGAADLLAARDAHSRKDYAKCVEIYEKWLALRPTSSRAPEALFNLGRCRFDMGEFDLARQTFDRIVTDFPASEIKPQSLHSRALCEMRLSQWATALQTLGTLRVVYPDYEPKKIEGLVESVRARMR